MKHMNFKILLMSGVTTFLSLYTTTYARAATGSWDCGTVVGKVTCTLASDGTLTVSGTGDMKGGYDNNAPWHALNSSVKNIVVEEGVTSIGSGSFAHLNQLQTVKMADSVKTVNGWAFAESSMTSVQMGGVTTLGIGAFQYSPNLQSVYMPNVETLGKSAFLQNTSLKSVDMPNLKSADNMAFRFSSNLEYVGFPSTASIPDPSGVFYQTKVANCRTNNMSACGSCGDKFLTPGLGCVSECGIGYVASGKECVAGEEVKLRYTLPEADAATSNDNENMIEWIFE